MPDARQQLKGLTVVQSVTMDFLLEMSASLSHNKETKMIVLSYWPNISKVNKSVKESSYVSVWDVMA